MTKKCDFCGKPIDVYQGHYVNAYEDAWQMKSYHSACYSELIFQRFRPTGERRDPRQEQDNPGIQGHISCTEGGG